MKPPRATHAPLMLSVSGCRGIVGASLTPDVLCAYAGAWADHVRAQRDTPRPRLVVGRDGRRGGAAIANIIIGALTAAGCDVIDLGVAMTPSVGVMVLGHDADGGLVITASHNPGEWNGLKPITARGGAPAPDEIQRFIDRFHQQNPAWADADRIGVVTPDHSAADVHVRRVLEWVGRLTPLDLIRERKYRVILDSVNASGAIGGRLLLERLGCNVTHINHSPDGVFPHPPEPIAEHLTSLASDVEKSEADIGFAQDPDADRLAIVDADGRFIGEEYTLALAARCLLTCLPANEAAGAILAANLSTSRMIDDVAARSEASVVRSPVGEANVVRAMRDHAARLGGEGNGGVIVPEIVPIRDSLVAMALTLALMSRSGAAVSALVEQIPAYAIVKRKLPIAEGMAERVVANLRTMFDGATIDEQDGIRLDFEAPTPGGVSDRAWLHARPSNTEPIFRLIAEAPTRADAEAIIDRAESEAT